MEERDETLHERVALRHDRGVTLQDLDDRQAVESADRHGATLGGTLDQDAMGEGLGA